MESSKTYRNLGFTLILFIIVVVAVYILVQDNTPTTKEEYFNSIYEGSEEYGYLYNGFAFLEDGTGGYITEISINSDVGTKVIEIPVHMGPRNLTQVQASGWINDSYFNSGQIYITFDPESDNMKHIALSAAELSLNLYDGLGVTPIAACTKNVDVCEGRPIVTCESDVPVIFLKDSNNSATVSYEGNCMILEGKGEELLKSVDYILLKWYRIL